MAVFLDDGMKSRAAQYLLARAVRSLWHPAETVRPTSDADEVVAGSVQYPWGGELISALGALLIRAARLESDTCKAEKLVVQGAGDPGLAEMLLAKARETVSQTSTDGWTDDDMRGHLLLERFMEDHNLQWNRVIDDDSDESYDERSKRQLRELIWAGTRALATMASSLSGLSGPWQLLGRLDDDRIVSIYADEEVERIELQTEQDLDEVEATALAHAAVWIAIRRTEALDFEENAWLVERVAQDVSPFHQVVYSALLMAGVAPMREAVRISDGPAEVFTFLAGFIQAMVATEGERGSEDRLEEDVADAYDSMHQVLEEVLLDDEDDITDRLLAVLEIVGRSARLTRTDVNPRRGVEGHISSPDELAAELLRRPAEYAATVLATETNEDDLIRLRALAIVAQIEPGLAGHMAADFADLSSDDPRMEPAARARAVQWVEGAIRAAQERSTLPVGKVRVALSDDAKTVLAAVMAGQALVDEWPVQRLVAAAAESASGVLWEASALDRSDDVFGRP
ncbi:hypothetical protein [Microlunatus sp. GCM10028923]|uniref:hypothetical protein n=1 Tax=Microlunatus sp. GCM10028923 TaxID=3273400 RepID=UPI003613126F